MKTRYKGFVIHWRANHDIGGARTERGLIIASLLTIEIGEL
jgi:hypothetical protein